MHATRERRLRLKSCARTTHVRTLVVSDQQTESTLVDSNGQKSWRALQSSGVDAMKSDTTDETKRVCNDIVIGLDRAARVSRWPGQNTTIVVATPGCRRDVFVAPSGARTTRGTPACKSDSASSSREASCSRL